jgi:hypothetical protein
MTKEEVMGLEGDFTWGFDIEFFIETCQGNFIWKDPDYGGDNTIISVDYFYGDWIRAKGIPYG